MSEEYATLLRWVAVEEARRKVEEEWKRLREREEQLLRVEAALRGARARPPSFKPELPQGYLDALRSLAVQSVYGRWNRERRASTLAEISADVKKAIRRLMALGEWPRGWGLPSKRTIDRRVNELHRPEECGQDPPPLLCVKPGVYMPHPARFEDEARRRVEEAVAALRSGR